MRSDALRTLHARSRTAANVHPMRMEPRAAPALPGGARADLVFMCDVFESIETARREELVRSLRAILAPAGRLVVIERCAPPGPSLTCRRLQPRVGEAA